MVSTTIPLRRSVLFAPASNARALEKLPSLGADAVVLDLEDAVGPAQKDAARLAAVAFVQHAAGLAGELVVRVNALETPEGAADLQAILPLGPDAILLPKVNSAEDLARVSAAFDELDARRGMAIWAMIETPKAALHVGDIAHLGARRRLGALVVGTNDLGAALRMPAATRRKHLQPFLLETVMAARAYGLAAIDGVYNDHRDAAGFSAEGAEARALGFDGKSLIHPAQIPLCHQAFAPDLHEIAWAERVVAAFQVPENIETGVISVDGQMVERLHLEEARSILARVRADGPAAAAGTGGASDPSEAASDGMDALPHQAAS